MLVASSIVSDSVVVDTAIVFSEAVDSALVGDPKLVEELSLTVSSLVIEVDTFVGVDLRTVVGVDSVVVLERDSVIVMVLVGDIVVTMALQLNLDTGGQVRLIQLQLYDDSISMQVEFNPLSLPDPIPLPVPLSLTLQTIILGIIIISPVSFLQVILTLAEHTWPCHSRLSPAISLQQPSAST